LTLWFDLPAAVAADRRAAVRSPDRFEQQDVTFFERVSAGYRSRAHADPARFVRIDALLPAPQVAAQIDTALRGHGW
jgi:dTMP kinase